MAVLKSGSYFVSVGGRLSKMTSMSVIAKVCDKPCELTRFAFKVGSPDPTRAYIKTYSWVLGVLLAVWVESAYSNCTAAQ